MNLAELRKSREDLLRKCEDLGIKTPAELDALSVAATAPMLTDTRPFDLTDEEAAEVEDLVAKHSNDELVALLGTKTEIATAIVLMQRA